MRKLHRVRHAIAPGGRIRATRLSAAVATALLLFTSRTTRAEDRCGLGVYFGHAPALQITAVVPGSAAAEAGVKPGDIIGAVNGVFVFSTEDLLAQLRPLSCGDDLILSMVNVVDSPIPHSVHLRLAQFRRDGNQSDETGGKFTAPPDYPKVPPLGRIAPLTKEAATSAAGEAASLKHKTREEFERGYYLGHKNFEGEGAKKFWTSALTGVQVGKAELRFYLMTPYSEARFDIYEKQQQFEKIDLDELLSRFEGQRLAFVVVLQDAEAERLAANLVGWGSLATDTNISKVVIRRGGTIYPSVGTQGAGWAFPLEVFEQSSDIEIIAVSRDNLHAIIRVPTSKLKHMR